MSATIDRALWCPKPIRHLFVGADIRTRCEDEHPPRLFNVGDAVWIAMCPRRPSVCNGGRIASTLYRIGVAADVPAAASRLQRYDVPTVAEALASAQPLPAVDPSDLAPYRDVRIAEALHPTSWGFLVRTAAPGLVAYVGEQPIAIIGCTEPGAQQLRRALPKDQRHVIPLARERHRAQRALREAQP